MFKNVCINPTLNFVLFKFCCGMYRNLIVYFHHTFSVSRKTSRFKCISKSSSTSEIQRANYNIISRTSHWNVFYKKGILEISSKVSQKYLWLSSYLVNDLWVWLLLKFSLFLDSAKEASSKITTFLNMRCVTTLNPALFWENILC